MKKISLKVKIIISVFVVIFIVGASAIYWIFNYTNDNFILQEKNNLKVVTEQKLKEIEVIFNSNLLLSKTAAAQPFIINFLKEDNPTIQDIDILEHLEFCNVEGVFSAIYLMNLNGDVLVSTNTSFVGQNYSFRDYFQGAVKGDVYIDSALGVTSHELGFYIATPIKSDDVILGVMVFKMTPTFLEDFIKPIDTIGGGHLMLVDEYGVILSSDKKERIFSSLGKLSKETQSIIAEKRVFEGIDIQPLDYDAVYNDVRGGMTSSVISFYDVHDRADELVILLKLKNAPFYLILEEDLAPYLYLSRQIAFILIFWIAILEIIIMITIIFIINHFLNPLRQIKEAVQSVMNGDLNVRVNIKTGDEIEELANYFNKMADNLKKSKLDVDKKISERTKQLEGLNKSMIGREKKMIELKKKINNSKK